MAGGVTWRSRRICEPNNRHDRPLKNRAGQPHSRWSKAEKAEKAKRRKKAGVVAFRGVGGGTEKRVSECRKHAGEASCRGLLQRENEGLAGFVLSGGEVACGAARKAAKRKNACEAGKYLAPLVFAVEETKKIQSAVYAELEGTRSCRGVKKRGKR